MARLSTTLKINPSTSLRVYKKNSSKKRFVRVRYFFNLVLALGLVIGGAGLIFWASYLRDWRIDEPKAGQNQTIQTSVEVNLKPARIYIPRLARNLDISDGYIENNRWKVATSGVSYLITSGQIGRVGNVVIYGHNTIGVLGGLWRIQNGDFVEVTAEDGKVYKYEIFERKEVKPNAVEILTQTGDARLTIYTCSGFLDSARFVVVGKLASSI